MEAIFIYLRFEVEKTFVQLETGEKSSSGGAGEP
jgi:hypothetical protein